MAELERRPTPKDIAAKYSKEKARPVGPVKFEDSGRKALSYLKHEIVTLGNKSIQEMVSADPAIELLINTFDDKESFMACSSLRSEVAVGGSDTILRNKRGMAPFEGETYLMAERYELFADLRRNNSMHKTSLEKIQSVIGTAADYIDLFQHGLLPEGERIITSTQTIAEREESVHERDVYGQETKYLEKRIKPASIAIVSTTEDGLTVTDYDALKRDKDLVVYPLFVPASVHIRKIPGRLRR